MMKTLKPNPTLLFFCLLLLLGGGLAACQNEAGATPTLVATLASVSEQPQQGEPEDTGTVPPTAKVVPTPDPAAIEAAWQSSPHADAFVQDAAGQNNTCARCHAPINWMPSMDDLPESCYACKFELEDPPSYIPETEWQDIPCNVCHKVDKKDNILAEYAWLEIAPLGEYAAVASPTELCLKCHAPVDLAGHGDVTLGGAHAGYECTACHSAHAIATSCVAEGCHPDVIAPVDPIPGHDADHQIVSCVACHDAGGMEVGLDEEQAVWTTFTTEPAGDSTDRFAFTSHNTVLEAKCDRCHFVDNPWGLSVVTEQP